jgi:hypothetical protein
MMGERRAGQEALFYEFSLEQHVPETHLLQSIDRFVELDGLRHELAPFYSSIPAFSRSRVDDPDADRGLLLWHPLATALVRGGSFEPRVSLVLSARSRRLGTGPLDLLEEPAWPFSREQSATSAFRAVLQRCIDVGLVGGEGFAVDASLIQADTSDRKRVEGTAGLPPGAAGRAVEEYLAVLDDAALVGATEVTPKFIAPCCYRGC